MGTTKASWRRRTGGAATLAVAAVAQAAPSSVEPTIDLRAVATDNSGLTATGRRSDVIGDLDAGVVVHLRGARLRATGDVGVDFIGYADHTQSDRILPRGRLDGEATLVDQALFFSAGVQASRTRSDPLAPQSDGASTANTVSTVSARASPYLALDLGPAVSALVRSDTVVTHNSGAGSNAVATMSGSTFQQQRARLERRPVPVGMFVEASHEETTYRDSDASLLRNDSALAGVSDAIDAGLLAGLLAGRERAEFFGQVLDETRYGAFLRWRPSPRAEFDATVEHRYFGTGWSLHLRDRMPLAIFDLGLQRTASASTSAIGALTPDSDPRTLLGSLLSTQLPIEADRDAAVDTILTNQDLPATFSGPLQVNSESVQRITRGTLDVIANGARNTVYASAYFTEAQALGGAAPGSSTASFDSRQWGASVGWRHRLSVRLTGGAEFAWSRIDGLGARAGESSRQLTATFSVTQQLARNGAFTCGLRHFSARLELDATGTSNVDENQAFASLRMQY